MKFKEENIQVFIAFFRSVKEKIEAQPGCYSVELMCDIEDPATMFTYSIWEDASSLETYRNTELFRSSWSKTKAMFCERPEAWSLNYI